MKIAVLKDLTPNEARVAATPDSIAKLMNLGFTITVEKGAGEKSSLTDAMFKDAGADVKDGAVAVKGADIIFTVNAPTKEQISALPKGAILVGLLNPYDNKDLSDYAGAGLSAFAMELMPRITKAQSMDVLSSQSNLAGYKAVVDAASLHNRAFPMMMTAAGTVTPARVLVIGAGVAGLQAIATARRLGAVVHAFDVRAATKEQVESLGATFVDVPGVSDAETKAGYAKELTEADKKKQQAKLAEVLKETDICITTALIPGKPAPKIITTQMVKDMPQGSIIVDLAAPRGGNCEATQPGKTATVHGVKIVGTTDILSSIARDASQLYARNLVNFTGVLVDKESGKINLDMDEQIITDTLLTHKGKLAHPSFGGTKPTADKKPANSSKKPTPKKPADKTKKATNA